MHNLARPWVRAHSGRRLRFHRKAFCRINGIEIDGPCESHAGTCTVPSWNDTNPVVVKVETIRKHEKTVVRDLWTVNQQHPRPSESNENRTYLTQINCEVNEKQSSRRIPRSHKINLISCPFPNLVLLRRMRNLLEAASLHFPTRRRR